MSCFLTVKFSILEILTTCRRLTTFPHHAPNDSSNERARIFHDQLKVGGRSLVGPESNIEGDLKMIVLRVG